MPSNNRGTPPASSTGKARHAAHVAAACILGAEHIPHPHHGRDLPSSHRDHQGGRASSPANDDARGSHAGVATTPAPRVVRESEGASDGGLETEGAAAVPPGLPAEPQARTGHLPPPVPKWGTAASGGGHRLRRRTNGWGRLSGDNGGRRCSRVGGAAAGAGAGGAATGAAGAPTATGFKFGSTDTAAADVKVFRAGGTGHFNAVVTETASAAGTTADAAGAISGRAGASGAGLGPGGKGGFVAVVVVAGTGIEIFLPAVRPEARGSFLPAFGEVEGGGRKPAAPVARETVAPVAREPVAPVAREPVAPVARESVARLPLLLAAEPVTPVARVPVAPVASVPVAPVARVPVAPVAPCASSFSCRPLSPLLS
ncbi:unnamed protein product [Closterium sp. NIES-54]